MTEIDRAKIIYNNAIRKIQQLGVWIKARIFGENITILDGDPMTIRLDFWKPDEKFDSKLDPKVWYLASPYSHDDVEIRIDRYKAVCKAAAWAMNQGLFIYAPIAHSHGIAEYGQISGSWDYWQEYDKQMIERCDGLIVCCIDGWNKSIGVLAEIKIAESLDHEILYLNIDPYTLESE